MKTIAEIPILTPNYFHTLLDNIEEIIIATDKGFRIKYWNREAERVFKFSNEEVIGKEVASVLRMLFSEESLNDIKSNLRTNSFWKGQLQYKNKSGKLLTFEVSITAIKDDLDKVVGYVGLHRNITDQLAAEIALMEALAKEHQLNDMKNRFVLMASHEFRTPFSAILSSTNLIEKYRTTEQQPNRTRHINRIKEAIHHMNEILEDFLSLCSLEEGKISVKATTFNLQTIITSIIEDLMLIKKPGQTIAFEHFGNTDVRIDRRLFKNIVINLVSNAIKFSGEDQKISIVTQNYNGSIRIQIEDEGVGVSKEDQKYLFKSFYRGKNAQHVEGTGLGLHITKRYVELLGGTIELESEANKGTTVAIELPSDIE